MSAGANVTTQNRRRVTEGTVIGLLAGRALQPEQGSGGTRILDLAVGDQRGRVVERNPLDPVGLEVGFWRTAVYRVAGDEQVHGGIGQAAVLAQGEQRLRFDCLPAGLGQCLARDAVAARSAAVSVQAAIPEGSSQPPLPGMNRYLHSSNTRCSASTIAVMVSGGTRTR